jgi:hypothetical protein
VMKGEGVVMPDIKVIARPVVAMGAR